MSTQRRLISALALMVLAAAVAVVWLVRDADGSAADVTSAASSGATAVSAEARSSLRDVAAEAAARVYSYSWESLDDDKAEARALMTGDMLAQYDRTMAGVGHVEPTRPHRGLRRGRRHRSRDRDDVVRPGAGVRQPEHHRGRPGGADPRPRSGAGHPRPHSAASGRSASSTPCEHAPRTEGSRRGRRDDRPAHHRSRPDGALLRLLRRVPRHECRGRRLAARARRPDHRDVSREGDPRRGRLPEHQGA